MRRTEHSESNNAGLGPEPRPDSRRASDARPAESNTSSACVDAGNELSVVFVPYWGAGNPYQDALADQIVAQGAKVQQLFSLRLLFHHGVFLRRKPDVVHLHWLPVFGWRQLRAFRCFALVMRLVLLRLRGIPLVWTVHNLVPHESRHPKMDWLLARVVAGLSNGIIVHGQSAKQQAMDTWRFHDPDRFAVIPHGNYTRNYPNDISRAAARDRLALDNSRLTFLFLGAVRPYKGVLELIQVFRRLPADRVSLLIAGQPLNDDFAREIETAIGDMDNVHFTPGFVEEDQVQVYMNAADVVTLPYRHVLSSGAALLAMSFGKPCVAPAVGCLGDVLDASGAFLYDPESETGLAESMRGAIVAKDRLAQMGDHNRDKVSQWTWESAAEATLALYDRCRPGARSTNHNA